MAPFTLRHLKRIIDIWVERLRLTDWHIKIRWAKPDEIETGDDFNFGICNSEITDRSAELIITHPRHYAEEDRADKKRDIEVFIIHELSHLHFAVFATEPGSALEHAEENIVNLYSRLLVAIDRRDDEITGRKFSKRASLQIRTRVAEKTKEHIITSA